MQDFRDTPGVIAQAPPIVPAAVLVGDGQEIAAGISGAQLVTVTDCDHLSTLEQPPCGQCSYVGMAWRVRG
jgi:pimeloyl-ACP methyl ester carboxylesterase